MRFRIEITRTVGARSVVVYRASVDEMSPHRAKVKAEALLNLYAGRGANGARVLNEKDEELYRW